MIQQSYFWVYIQKQNSILKRYLHSHVYCFIIHSSQDLETMDKENVRHTHVHPELSVSLKKEGNLPICNNLVESGGHYA